MSAPRRRVDVSEERRAVLNSGAAACADLVESLVVDQCLLARAVFPKFGISLPPEDALLAIAGAPLKQRLGFFANHLAAVGSVALARLTEHPSDTVRSWVAFAHEQDKNPVSRLAKLRPFAADSHFGVREYAWMAYRSALIGSDGAHAVSAFETAFEALRPWATDGDANLRRFASEATRPRGVWCIHLRVLRNDPSKGLPILEPLARDSSRYVRLSVANWLNDASKDDPAFVRATTERWLAAHPCPETTHIATHALRTLKKQSPSEDSAGL